MPRDYKVYLDDILEAIGKIETYITGMDYDIFRADGRTVDAVVRNLEIIGEAAKNLPEAVKEATPEIEWFKVIGMRNILAHEYFGINLEIIWDIVNTEIKPVKTVVQKLLDE